MLVSSADHTSAKYHSARSRETEQSPTKGAVCRPSRHRLSDEVFPATHESGNTRGTAEFTTMPRVKQSSSGDNALYTHSRVKARGVSGSG